MQRQNRRQDANVEFSAWELRRRMERGAALVLVSTSQAAPDLEDVAEGVRPPPGQATMTRPLPNDSIPLPTPAEAPPDVGKGRSVCARPGLASRHRRVPVRSRRVLTQTAKVHAAAWKEMFDAYLRERSEHTGEPFRPFEIATDYATYVDGKLRQDGVRAFLASRAIFLPEGSADDPPTALTVHGLGNRKNDLVLDLIRRRGVDVYDGSVRFVEAVRDVGLRRAVVSASKNCQAVLAAAGIEHLFEVRVDGIVAAEAGLRGKPAPDTFLAAAAALGVQPAHCAVFEDAIAGVEAGRAGSFRVGRRRRPRRAGRSLAQPRRRYGGQRPERVAGGPMILPDVFSIEPRAVAEPELRLDLLAHTASIFALR